MPQVKAADIVAGARKYIGVEFGHQGRARLGDHRPQMDCVGVLFCVGEDLELSDRLGVRIHRDDTRTYGPQPTDEFIHEECKRRLLTVEEFGKSPLRTSLAARIVPGEVLTLRIPNVICHAAIVTGVEPHPTILYAMPASQRHQLAPRNPNRGRVVETLLEYRRSAIAGIFKFPGVSY
jgi:hypothetical protein